MSIEELVSNTSKISKLLGITEKPNLKAILSKLKETANSEGVSRIDIVALKAYAEFEPFAHMLNSNDYTEDRSLIGTNRLTDVLDEIIAQL